MVNPIQAFMGGVTKLYDTATGKYAYQKSTSGAGHVRVTANDVRVNRISRSMTVLDSTNLSTAGTPGLWIPMDNWDEVTVSATTASTTGNLVIEYSMDGGATTEAVTTTKALTASGDAVIQFSDLEESATANDPALTTLAKTAAYFRPSISGGSANAGTIKVFMRGWE